MFDYDTQDNKGNKSSKNHYVLNNKDLKGVKKLLEFYLQDYFDQIIQTKNKVKPYITQSWFNYTNKEENHHMHSHQNSHLSGVLYVDTDETDCITFHRRTDNGFKFEPKDYNPFNCITNTVPVRAGDVLIFPSTMVHSVPTRFKGEEPRVSIAFNTWVKGTLGDNDNMTELKI